MTSSCASRALILVVLGSLAACGGGGGSGETTITGTKIPNDNEGGGAIPETKADKLVRTYATTGMDGSFAEVDLVDGGNPDTGLPNDVAKQAFLDKLMTVGGLDVNGDAVLDAYKTGDKPAGDPGKATAGLILAANNIYDLFQTTTGAPEVALVDSQSPELAEIFEGFTGGDIDGTVPGGDPTGDGGPGLFSNVPGSGFPKLPSLPNTMGTLVGGSGRGPSATDQHQFIQIVFPYKLDRESLFNTLNTTNSFLGDSAVGASDNVFIEARWIEMKPLNPQQVGSPLNPADQSVQHRVVTGVAIIGGMAAVPADVGGTTLAKVDTSANNSSNLPLGCLKRVGDPDTFTFIAHENPTLITKLGSANVAGTITGDNMLVLPSASGSPGGGRVFAANTQVPGSVNDFLTDAAGADAATVGFFSIRFSRVRSGGETINNPYFHSFPFSQANVGADPAAVAGTFNRGPAVYINENTSIPDIDIFSPGADAIGAYNPFPGSDATNVISTRARFLVRFDREVVPNSVGFSRRHTIQRLPAQGVVFAFNGNTRPVSSPASLIVPGKSGSPLAPSIYLAVNQPAGVNKSPAVPPTFGLLQKVNSLVDKKGAKVFDDGSAMSITQQNGNGLVPQQHNTLATLPRGVVPCDIYPLNQNNLNAYVVQPLVELPPNSVVTLGVCMAGLGYSSVLNRTNHGNFTRSGTMFTTYQGLSSVGLGEDASQKTAIIGNDTVIKINAGPMDLQGRLFYGGTSVAIDTLINGLPLDGNTTGGTNVCRTFRVGTDNKHMYVNAPVAPQALYLAYNAGGLGILDLAGTGYNTNKPGGSALNIGHINYLEVTRYLPPTITGNLSLFNYKPDGSFASGTQFKGYGIMGRYTSGGAWNGLPPGTESERALGAAIQTGPLTPVPGINEGSSGYETLVRTGMIGGDPNTSTQFVASPGTVGVVRDIEVGDFLDTVFNDKENPFATTLRHRTYNTPLQGSIDNNTIADPPLPNPPPQRFPVGLPHTAVVFDQTDLDKAPFLIEGNEVFAADLSMMYDAGQGFPLLTRPVNGFIQLNPSSNTTGETIDKPNLPNAGYNNPFPNAGGQAVIKFVQTGPMPKTATAGAVILTTLNLPAPGTYDSGGLVPPVYQSRQQIGNFLFVADGVNKRLHALNSNTMEIIQSLKLPDPTGLGLSPKLQTLYVSNEGTNNLSVVDADPTSVKFMTEIKSIPCGTGPRAVAVCPNDEDVLVLNYLANTVTIVDVATQSVRNTLKQNGLNRPYDVAIGAREAANMPGFGSGAYHGFISNFGGNNVLIYESGPSGLGGIGFDNIIGGVRPNEPPQSGVPLLQDMQEPRGITLDPVAEGASFLGNQRTVGAFVAHKDQSGRGAVSRISYSKDTSPGQGQIGFTGNPSFGSKIFEVTGQYLSTFVGVAYDVALPDFNRKRLENEDFGSYYNLFNAGATPKTIPIFDRNQKFPTADNILPTTFNGPRWEPDRVYLSMSGKIIEVFDLETGVHLKTITTPQDVAIMTPYFSQ